MGNQDRPVVRLTGENGNIYNLMGIARKALNRAGRSADAKIMCEQVQQCKSYDEGIMIIGEYVDIE